MKATRATRRTLLVGAGLAAAATALPRPASAVPIPLPAAPTVNGASMTIQLNRDSGRLQIFAIDGAHRAVQIYNPFPLRDRQTWSDWELLDADDGRRFFGRLAAQLANDTLITVFGTGTDDRICYARQGFARIMGPLSPAIGGLSGNSPSTLLRGDRRIEVLVRGVGGDLFVNVESTPDSDSFTGWQVLNESQTILGPPVGFTWPDNTNEVFVQRTDGRLYSTVRRTTPAGAGYGGYESLGGELFSGLLTVVVDAAARPVLFVNRRGTVWYSWPTGFAGATVPRTWQPIPGPEIVGNVAGAFDARTNLPRVYAQSSDGAGLETTVGSGGTPGWRPFGGLFSGDFAAFEVPSDRTHHVVGRGRDGLPWIKQQLDNRTDRWQDWQHLARTADG